MKMDPEDYAELEEAIRPLMAVHRWDLFKMLGCKPKRYRWALLDKAGLRRWAWSLGLTEGEIDAALRKITRST